MTSLDPRTQMACLAAVVLGAVFGGIAGLVAGAAFAVAVLVMAGAVPNAARVFAALLPMALIVGALDAFAGRAVEGIDAGARLLVLAMSGFAFSCAANGEAMIAGLRALRVPYSVVFVLVAGARFIPATGADLATMRDAARLRGLPLDGPPWRQLAGWRVLLVPLLVDTVRRGLQLGEAMEARAFGAARVRTTRHTLKWRLQDSLVLLAAAAYVAALILLPRLI